jgi:Sensors of blue-light using FAD
MSDEELLQILTESCKRNVEVGITGMLLYKDGSFMQLLEGTKQNVLGAYHRICRDPRHTGLIIMRQAESDGRSFPDWSMGFRSVRAADLDRVPGFSKLGSQTFASPAVVAKPHVAIRALKSFHSAAWMLLHQVEVLREGRGMKMADAL